MDTSTPPAGRRPGSSAAALGISVLLLALVAALVVGVVLNKRADDRREADRRPTDVTCTATLNALAEANGAATGWATAKGDVTAARQKAASTLTKAHDELQPAAGTAFDRGQTGAAAAAIALLQKQLTTARPGATLDTSTLNTLSLQTLQSCSA